VLQGWLLFPQPQIPTLSRQFVLGCFDDVYMREAKEIVTASLRPRNG
jgi:hypothetical protein